LKLLFRIGLVIVGLLVLGGLVAVSGFYAAKAYYEPELPSVASLRDMKLGVPLRIFSHDGKLIGEFGAERREPLRYDQIPQPIIQAFLAAEDDRFFEHPGVDWQGLVRASFKLATTGEKRQGGSTITMQLARNVFLSPERKFSRKIKEILLALKIEHELDKKEILALYLNQIFLGNRAYGVGAAAQVYFGKSVDELTLGEAATIAGLPKAPSRDNPLSNPVRAKERRDYVLRRMRDLGYTSREQFELAQAEPITAHEHPPQVELDAHYVAEMVRAEIVEKYGEAAYTNGYTVVTTLDSTRQKAANAALRGGILAYEERHGFDGPEAKLPPELIGRLEREPGSTEIRAQLDARPPVASLLPAIVLSFSPEKLSVLTREGAVELPKAAFAWASLSDKKPLHEGDIVRIARVGEAWRLEQIPHVQGAFVAVDPNDGAIQALIGGYDFFLGSYNRVTQARRQVGSGFKPILYTAALSKGYTPASIFLDAPVVFANVNPDDDWRPGNYNGRFNGPMRLREALAQSRNLVSVRVAQAVGVGYTRQFATRFGFPKDRLPNDLTIALGSAALTPLEQARAYSVFANGGFLIDPYFIESITDGSGNEVFRAHPKRACPGCDVPAPPLPVDPDSPEGPAPAEAPDTDAVITPPATDAAPFGPATTTPAVDAADRAPRTLEASLDFLITSMLHDVVTRGTAAAVKALGRTDLAGKTGTTNDEQDAWFNGFNPTLVGISWIGFDTPKPLGKGEVGGRAALPVWMDFMKTALKGVPQQMLARPAGLVDVAINPVNGKAVTPGTPGSMVEVVQQDRIPPHDDGLNPNGEGQAAGTDIY
jgi:penicillin-binding protein 1A